MDSINSKRSTPGGLSLSFDDVMSILSARRWYFVVPSVIGTIIAFGIAGVLPAQYKATAVISVESQQIPEELVRSTVTSNAAERIDYITQRVLTRSRVLETAKALEIFSGEGLSDTEVVEKFRSNVDIGLVSTGVGRSRNSQTVSFTVSFLSGSPDTAQSVANELVTMFLDENVRTRSARAAQTTEFLAEEGEKIREQINSLELLISNFKKENRESMPELVQMNLALMSRYENEYQAVVLDLEELEAERRILQLQRDQYQGLSRLSGSNLSELQRQYAEVLVRHTSRHPDAVYLAREIEKLKDKQKLSAAASEQASGIDLISDPGYARLSTQLEAVTRKAAYLNRTRKELESKLFEQESRIARAPEVEQEFVDLQRDLKNLESKYQELRDKEIEAQISQNLEEDQKGERFSLLEAAIAPSSPVSPNRLAILLGGMCASLGIGLFSIAMREFVSSGIRSLATLEAELGAPPLLVVPDFGSPSSLSAWISWRSLAIACLVAAALTVLAFQVVLTNQGFAILNEALSL